MQLTPPVRTPQELQRIGQAVNAMVSDDRQRTDVLRAAMSAPRQAGDVVTVLKAVDDTFGDDNYEAQLAPWALHHRRAADDFRVIGPKVAAVVSDEGQRANAFTKVVDSWRDARDAAEFLQGIDDSFGDDSYESQAITRFADVHRAGASVRKFGPAVAAMVSDEGQRADVLGVAMSSTRDDADLVRTLKAVDDTFGDDNFEVRAARPAIESRRSGSDIGTIGTSIASLLSDEAQRFELLGVTLRSSMSAGDIRDGLRAIDSTFGDDTQELNAAVEWLRPTTG